MNRTWLICYDVSDHRARRRCLRLLRVHASGYQDSCFEVTLAPTALTHLLSELTACINDDTDQLLVAPLGGLSETWQLGHGPSTPSGHLLVIN